MQNLKNKTNIHNKTETDIQNKLVVTTGNRKGEKDGVWD